MLIDKISIAKQAFSSVKTHTLNLGLKSSKTSLTQSFLWAPIRKENSDKFVQGKVVAWSFDFSSKSQLSIFFNFHFSLVYFIGAFYTDRTGDLP